MNTHKMQKAAPLLVAAAAIIWGILVIFVRKLNAGGLGAMEIVCIRVYGSAFFLFVGIGILQEKLLVIKIRDFWCFVGTGVFSIVFFSYCYFRNVEISSVALSSILMYTSPVWVTLISAICFKERVTGRKMLALLLALTGCVLVSGIIGGQAEASGRMGESSKVIEQVSLQGILLGLGSGIGYGFYSIFGRFALNKGYHPMTVSAYTFLFACVGVLPFVNISSILNKLVDDPALIIWCICISLFTTCVSFSLYTLGLQYMEPGRAAVLATLEPIVSTLVGVFYYREPMTLLMIIGIVLVLVSSILISKAG